MNDWGVCEGFNGGKENVLDVVRSRRERPQQVSTLRACVHAPELKDLCKLEKCLLTFA